MRVFIIAAILLMLVGCDNRPASEKMGYDSVYNTELGYIVTLGMTKEKLDNMLGEGRKPYYYYEYSDGLEVEFTDGKISLIVLRDMWSPWSVKHKIKPHDYVDDVFSAYGEDDIFDIAEHLGDDNPLSLSGALVSYYFDKKSKQSDVGDHAFSISFHLDDDKKRVESIRLTAND